MSKVGRWLHKQLAGIVALVLAAGMLVVSQIPQSSASQLEAQAGEYGFKPMSISMPSGFPQQEIRKVNKDYSHIDAWISSVGAGIAMNDLDGDGLSNDLCITDPRIDQVVVTPTPGAGGKRYRPFAVQTNPLPTATTVAPMGCAPADFNEDGRMDLLVYYWGRTPVVFLAKANADGLSKHAYTPVELVRNAGGATYTGEQWNTNAVAIDDFDGDGHIDIYVGNYFPHGPVLDPTVSGGVEMNRSLSNATNGGPAYFFRWTGGESGNEPSVSFDRLDDVLPENISHGWVLGSSANDVDGDLLPELYLAHDHGPDAMLHNRSTPGSIKFEPVVGERSPLLPKSKRIGADSFKGMGADFGDLDGNGLYDIFVSNITTSFGIQESNYQFMSTAENQADLRAQLADGVAPWSDRSTDYGTAWSGWCWDVKMGDFNNSGQLAITQANGFVKGDINRWPQLQELATANDLVLEHPEWWPNVTKGDDLAGSQRLHFFAKGDDGKFHNLAPQLGLDIPVPTRGIAVGDANGDGLLEFAVARQWDQPVFYQNTAANPGAFLGLKLLHPDGSPAVGAQVKATTDDGRTLLGRVDGGSGHSGKRSTDVHIGLGRNVTGPVQVELSWRDRDGNPRSQELQLTPGWHEVRLGARAEER